MSDTLDLKRLGVFLGIADTSDHDGEALNAIRMAGRLLRAAGMCWRDITDGHRRAEIATAAAEELAAALNRAEQRIAELEAENSRGTAVALWNAVGAKVAGTCMAVEWALDLNRRGLVWLSPNEIDFLGRAVPGWVGPLRPKQQARLQHILDRVVERTGMTPPP